MAPLNMGGRLRGPAVSSAASHQRSRWFLAAHQVSSLRDGSWGKGIGQEESDLLSTLGFSWGATGNHGNHAS